MRLHVVATVVCVLVAAIPVTGQAPSGALYTIEVDGKAQSKILTRDGKSGHYVTVQFKIVRADTGKIATDVLDEFVVEEDGKRVDKLEIVRPQSGPLTTILAIDISGSMRTDDRIGQAKRAANVFLDRLNERVDTGLILFDHEMRLKERPAGDPGRIVAHREGLRQHINAAVPLGGTAWRDATAEAVQLLEGIKGRKAVLVMTDGVDLNSRQSLEEVINLARIAEVPVYTIGVGEPGKNEPVTTVLTLDRSGSMLDRASDNDKLRKIEALHQAGTRFVDLIRPGARTTVLPFSDKPERPEEFTDDKKKLKDKIEGLRARGDTALFDATYDALMTLKLDTEATQARGERTGKRAVVAMTDGKDNRSRRRAVDVIILARETNTPLYLLGLGRPQQIDERTMRQMVEDTKDLGSEYFYIDNQQKLVEIFEKLSIRLHDDGIDQASLEELANKTGGKFFLARDVSKLQQFYEEVADELQTTYRLTFPSRRPYLDGYNSRVEISVERGGRRISNVARGYNARRGVVLADMDRSVYLGMLAGIGVLLALPVLGRRLLKGTNGG